MLEEHDKPRKDPDEAENRADTIHVSREETAGHQAEDLTTEQVRQGHTGDHVRYILLASVAGAVFVMAILITFFLT